MTTDELINHAAALITRIQPYAGAAGSGSQNYGAERAAKAQVCEFLRTYAGPKSAFTQQAEHADGAAHYLVPALTRIIKSYAEYLKSGLALGISPETKAQLDVVSDFLDQARLLLEASQTHPAAATVLIGASLEEFLRTWVEREALSIGNSKPGIDAYAKALRERELITKQDVKDITAWAGLRNHAAHGEWDMVSNRQQASLMLQGVNLFMRDHKPGK